MEILSSGQGEPESFVLRTTFVICWYDGEVKSYGIDGWEREGIQLGI